MRDVRLGTEHSMEEEGEFWLDNLTAGRDASRSFSGVRIRCAPVWCIQTAGRQVFQLGTDGFRVSLLPSVRVWGGRQDATRYGGPKTCRYGGGSLKPGRLALFQWQTKVGKQAIRASLMAAVINLCVTFEACAGISPH